MAEDWEHKDIWKRRGHDFLVKISRHEVAVNFEEPEWRREGPHRWAVYAYIYPKHPRFSRFVGEDMWQDAATSLDLHCYPSFLRRHYAADGSQTAVQVGADYNHLHDEQYTHMATREDARSVFRDAEALFDLLSSESGQTPIADDPTTATMAP